MIVLSNAISMIYHNGCLKINNIDNTISLMFFDNGRIDYVGTQETAVNFMFETFFQKNFLKEYLKDSLDDSLIIDNCIKINAYKGTIKYIGNYYSELPEWLQRVEARLKRVKELRAFL